MRSISDISCSTASAIEYAAVSSGSRVAGILLCCKLDGAAETGREEQRLSSQTMALGETENMTQVSMSTYSSAGILSTRQSLRAPDKA